MPHRKEGCLLFEENISRQNSKMCLFFRWVEEYLLPIYTQEWSRGQRAKEVLVFT